MSLKLPTRARRGLRLLIVMTALAAYVAGTAAILEAMGLPSHSREKGCRVVEDWFSCDGERLFIKGIGWDPTRPGELPWNSTRPDSLVRSDFAGIRAAGFNTLRTWAALTVKELAIAKEFDLWVLQGIWIDPAGNFGDPTFRMAQLDKVRHIVRYSSESRAVLGYLVMNEPNPGHIIAQGIEQSRGFLTEIAAAIREESPGALVSFASWPGLEFFDVPELDFVAVNLHPFRPRTLIDTIGYAGMVRLWKNRQAENRPLIVSEYGVSVSPTLPVPNRPGGASEVEQAQLLPRLAEDLVSGGAVGGVTFMWIDGWWKNGDGPGDELTHDTLDGEEWFGLNAMESLGDRAGRARPALAAMQRWNRAVLTQPLEGAAPTQPNPIEIYIEEDILTPRVFVGIDGQAPKEIPIEMRGNWLRGKGVWPETTENLRVTLQSGERVVAEWNRALRARHQEHALELRIDDGEDDVFAIVVVRDSHGDSMAHATVHIALVDASHRFDRSEVVTTDASGSARFALKLPPAPAHAVVVATLQDERGRVLHTQQSLVLGGESSR